MIIDDDQQAWIVYVEKHDEFHALAPAKLTAARAEEWMPNKADLVVLKRDAVARRDAVERVAVLGQVIALVSKALETSDVAAHGTVGQSGATDGTGLDVTVLIVGDGQAVLRGHESEHEAMVSLRARLRGWRSEEQRRNLVQALAALDPDGSMEAVYLPEDAGVEYTLTVSYAALAALEASSEIEQESERRLARRLTPTVLHYV